MKQEELLSWCFRCHRKFAEMGEVIRWGKHYPACRVKHIDGKEEFLPESVEIVEAICKDCMVEVNSKKYDERKCIRCNDNGCPACDGTKGSKYNPEPF